MIIDFTDDATEGGLEHVLGLMEGLVVNVIAGELAASGFITDVAENWLELRNVETDQRYGFHIDTIERVTYQ